LSSFPIERNKQAEGDKMDTLKKRSRLSTWMILAVKSAKLVKIVKLVKLLKFSKLIIMFSTMALSVFVYSFMMGPWFSFGFVLLLFLHEMGHIIAMNIKNIPTRAPVFIPMLGAVIFAPKFSDRETEAFVGYGGPLLGTIGSYVPLAFYFSIPTHPQIFLALSFTSLYLNLFNLIPIRPLDGGRVTQAVGSWFKYFGAGLLLLLPVIGRDAGMMLLWVLMLSEIKMNYNVRIGFGFICEIAMVILIFMGYGNYGASPIMTNVMNGVDILFATMLNIGYCAEAYKMDSTLPELPALSKNARVKWVVSYLALAIFIIIAMTLELPLLNMHK
jgi:Zn-dependent protease